MTVVLDSWAIIRYLEGGHPAASAVGRLLSREHPITSWINLGEVFYVIRRAVGEAEATTALRDLRVVVTPELPSADRVVQAARIKSDHAMAYADAFAAATAVAHKATLWTGDPELLLPRSPWRWKDLR